ncbi:Swi3p LALA0_S11e03862g [Lachancea lanzarotensis]|uniref:LALA0S11e03862g1_1 n=1 Tax=Lachancea lanzarotensis TaxID=1245769 RepID=A0A0C7N2R8_9SACH|nr:uncharacterized protein LALA0_S11e03862g [Lachancea lanzarotensis]CEP64427.1 LALA0S11e03862g1_1 [Lachancea lanzarotensis]
MPTADTRLAVWLPEKITCSSMTMEEAFKQDSEGLESSARDLVGGIHENHDEFAVDDTNGQDEPQTVVDKKQDSTVKAPKGAHFPEGPALDSLRPEFSHTDTNLSEDLSKPDPNSRTAEDEQAITSNEDVENEETKDRELEITTQELKSSASKSMENSATSFNREELEPEVEQDQEGKEEQEEEMIEGPEEEQRQEPKEEHVEEPQEEQVEEQEAEPKVNQEYIEGHLEDHKKTHEENSADVDENDQSSEQPLPFERDDERKDETYVESSIEPGVKNSVKVATKKPMESTDYAQEGKVESANADYGQEDHHLNPGTEHPLSSSAVKVESSHGLQHSITTEITGKASTAKPADLATPQSHDIVIPSYARWFHLQKIHSVEKQSLPEFFTNRIPSKTPQVYVKYRNFMVNSYRLNPNEFLTMTAARRSLCGDAGAILRIHKFLTKWGLINYQVDAKIKPKQVEPPFTGDFTTKHDAPRGLFPFESYKPAIQIPDLSRLKKLMHQIDPSPGVMHSEETKPSETNSQIGDDKKRKLEGSSEPLGPKVKLQRPNILETADKDWSKEDLEKLLQGLQKHKSDWQRVAHFVGNKTAEQCILRFLQLPIEDPFLQSNISDELGPLKYAPHLPFSKADNPVMSTIAFLVGLVDPNMVKKMTDRAIDSIKPDSEKETSPEAGSYIKEGSELALATLGARSHVFATNEERHMNALANEMIQLQLKKVGLKLQVLATMEKSLEMEKKAIQKQQEDTFIQRLSLAKHSNAINAKLQQCLDDFDDKMKLQAHFNDLKELQTEPARTSLGKGMSSTPVSDGTPHSQGRKSDDDLTKDPFVKPVSVDAPQAYRYWSG